MSNRKFTVESWNARHYASVEAFAQRVEQIYRSALKEAARLAVSLKIDPDKPFSFADYPQTQSRVSKIMQDMAKDVMVTIMMGQQQEYNLSNQKNDALVGSVLASSTKPTVPPARRMNQNQTVLTAFQARKVAGLNLSDRVWKYTNQFKREIEMGLDVGIGEGRSAQQISQDLRGFLKDPDKLFRRVRNRRGNLVLSQNAKDFNPGTGTYRSSYQNAMRLARTEINMAYREADRLRWNDLDFVVGIEVRRSNNPFPCMICDSLKGRYPKTYVFRSNHPNCRCYAIPILATPEELSKLNQMILAGQDTAGFMSENEVKEINPGYLEWVERNREQLVKTKSLPFFISDNFGRIPQLNFLQSR